MQTVAVIDYGMGNLHSVAKALEHVGAGKVLITSDAKVIREADRVVFPGVGAIRDCMAEIRRLGFDSLVREVSQDRPFLGICVGMQALLDDDLLVAGIAADHHRPDLHLVLFDLAFFQLHGIRIAALLCEFFDVILHKDFQFVFRVIIVFAVIFHNGFCYNTMFAHIDRCRCHIF